MKERAGAKRNRLEKQRLARVPRLLDEECVHDSSEMLLSDKYSYCRSCGALKWRTPDSDDPFSGEWKLPLMEAIRRNRRKN